MDIGQGLDRPAVPDRSRALARATCHVLGAACFTCDVPRAGCYVLTCHVLGATCSRAMCAVPRAPHAVCNVRRGSACDVPRAGCYVLTCDVRCATCSTCRVQRATGSACDVPCAPCSRATCSVRHAQVPRRAQYGRTSRQHEEPVAGRTSARTDGTWHVTREHVARARKARRRWHLEHIGRRTLSTSHIARRT
jgi:hypothetical protein